MNKIWIRWNCTNWNDSYAYRSDRAHGPDPVRARDLCPDLDPAPARACHHAFLRVNGADPEFGRLAGIVVVRVPAKIFPVGCCCHYCQKIETYDYGQREGTGDG